MQIGKRRARLPVLVTLGVRADGERVVLDVRLVSEESTAAWRDVIHTRGDGGRLSRCSFMLNG